MKVERSEVRQAVKQGIVAALLLMAVAIPVWLWWKMPKTQTQSLVATVPPEFPPGGTWVNAPAPLKLSELRGKVVLLQFGFLACAACRDMDPYLDQWQEKYRDQGFVVVEVDDGTSDTLEAVRDWVRTKKPRVPFYYDANGVMTQQYGVQMFPVRVLIGRDGKVAWEGRGWNGAEGATADEQIIQNALGAR